MNCFHKLAFLFLFLSACSGYQRTTGGKTAVPMYYGKVGHPYTEIGFIRRSGHGALLQSVSKEAAKEGADAMIVQSDVKTPSGSVTGTSKFAIGGGIFPGFTEYDSAITTDIVTETITATLIKWR
jgi:hypothetical protein